MCVCVCVCTSRVTQTTALLSTVVVLLELLAHKSDTVTSAGAYVVSPCKVLRLYVGNNYDNVIVYRVVARLDRKSVV